ncbi:MAG: hypothetical protein M3R21_08505, partial [Candidatus Dormibacteraeota bacterium]|nr:hypothetical protein [Candidatus Dormibacteraeota bacterium]
ALTWTRAATSVSLRQRSSRQDDLQRTDLRADRMSADLGLDALDGVGNLIADPASVGLDSVDRLPGGLATRFQPGEQPLPAL